MVEPQFQQADAREHPLVAQNPRYCLHCCIGGQFRSIVAIPESSKSLKPGFGLASLGNRATHDL